MYYSGPGYETVNRGILSGSIPAEVQSSIALIDEYLAKTTAAKNLQTFRGVARAVAQKLAGLSVGDTVAFPSYSSVSSQWSKAMDFAGSTDGSGLVVVVVEMQIPKGAHIASIYKSGWVDTQNSKKEGGVGWMINRSPPMVSLKYTSITMA